MNIRLTAPVFMIRCVTIYINYNPTSIQLPRRCPWLNYVIFTNEYRIASYFVVDYIRIRKMQLFYCNWAIG